MTTWRELAIVAVALLCTAAFTIRVLGVYPEVIRAGGVRLQEADPWYHLRRIEHLVANFPRVLTFDPYALHPGGQTVAVGPFLDLLVAGAALLLGGGAPSQALVLQIAAWAPAILGALVVPVAYLIAARCFDRSTGILAALLLALMPGAFLRYTLLGFCDHHVLEALLSGLALLLLMRACEGPVPPMARDATRTRRWWPDAAPWSLTAGLVLGAYLLSWVGGSLLVAVIFAWLAVQIVVDAAAGRPAGRVLAAALPALLVALAVVLPYVHAVHYLRFHIAALGGAVVSLPVLGGILHFAARIDPARPGRRRAAAVAGGLAWAGLGATGFFVVAPEVARGALGMVRTFLGGVPGGLVGETQALLVGPDGEFGLGAAWDAFAAGMWLAPLGLAVLAGGLLKRWTPARGLLLIWSALVLLATLRQVRFAYYAALNVSVLSALAVEWAGQRLAAGTGRRVLRPVVVVAAAVACAAAAVNPMLESARTFSGPDDAWCAALGWLRNNSPEPLGDAAAYTARYEDQREAEGAYGVLASWERGYWITALGRRIPCGNGTQAGAGETSRILVEQDPRAATRRLDELGARYVIVDHALRVWSAGGGRYSIGKFEHTVRWAGGDPREFFEVCFRPDGRGGQAPMFLFYPAYFQTLAVRLGVFGGAAVQPDEPVLVFKWEPRKGEGGRSARVLTAVEKLATYAAAQAFISSHSGERWVVGSTSPTSTCVPLEAVEGLVEVYASPTVVEHAAGRGVPEVRVFEATGPRP